MNTSNSVIQSSAIKRAIVVLATPATTLTDDHHRRMKVAVQDSTKPESNQQPEYREIPLTQGKAAIVDVEDFEFLNQWKWYAVVFKNSSYAVRRASIDGAQKRLWMHRVLLSAPKGEDVDHRNSNGLDNRRSNLRIATRQENVMNSRPTTTRQGKRFKGIRLAASGRWLAAISVGSTRISGGTFLTQEDAARAYDQLARQYHGDFAWLNFPSESITVVGHCGSGRRRR